jgi:hypothetical protein
MFSSSATFSFLLGESDITGKSNEALTSLLSKFWYLSNALKSQSKKYTKNSTAKSDNLDCDLRAFDKYQNLDNKDVKASLDLPVISDSPRRNENVADELNIKSGVDPNLFSTQNMDGFKSILKDSNNNELVNLAVSMDDTEFSFKDKSAAKTYSNVQKTKPKKATFNKETTLADKKNTDNTPINSTESQNNLSNSIITKKDGVDVLKDYFNMSYIKDHHDLRFINSYKDKSSFQNSFHNST